MVGWMDDEALHRTLDHRPRHVLVAVAAGVLGQGRDVRARPAREVGGAGLRRRRAAGQGRPGRRRPATPATAPASTRACCCCDRADQPRRPRRAAATHRLVPITRTLFADGETPVGVYRKLAAGRPGTFLLESAEAGRVVLALVVRRRRRARLAVGRRRRGRRGPGDVPGRAADRRRPARRARRGLARAQGPAAARPAAADRRLRRLPRLRRRAAHRAAARQGGRRARPARADHAAGHRPRRRRPPRVHGRADRQRAAAARTWTRRELDAAYADAVARLDAMQAALATPGRRPSPPCAPAPPKAGRVAHAGGRVPARGRAGARGGPGRRGVPDPGRPAVRRRDDRRPARRLPRAAHAQPVAVHVLPAHRPTSTSSAAARRRW